jgi:uncharacterized protein
MTTAALRWYKQFWPWALIALPAVVILASVITIIIAAGSADSLVVDDYYKQGLGINRTLAAQQEAARLHLHARARINAATATLQLVLSGDLPTSPTELSLLLVHPARSEQDIKLILHRNPDDSYSSNWPIARLANPSVRWRAVLQNMEHTWTVSTEIYLPNNTQFEFIAAPILEPGG